MTDRTTLNYTARDFDSVVSELTDFVTATRPEDQTDFFQSNLGVMLIELAAAVTDLLSYGQDITAQEIFLSTARRYDSALRFARSVGFVPRSARAARVTMTSETLPASVVTNGAIVSEGSFVTGNNGQRYEVDENFTLVPGSSVLTVNLIEGQKFTNAFIPTKQPRQEFFTSRGIVEQDSWSVFVGDVNDPTNEWTQVDTVAFEAGPTEVYEIFFDGQGRVHFVFGDDTAGKIPDDTITVIYRVTNGAAGNTAANTIRGSIKVDVIGTGTTASITLSNSTSAATGGLDRESVDSLRRSIPSFIRTLDQAITLTNYEEAVTLNNGTLTFADVPLSSRSGNIVRVHIWDEENFTFVSTSPTQGTTSAVNYQRYTQAPTLRIHEVQTYLRPRTLATVHNVVIRPTVAQVDLEFGNIKYDTLNRAEDVHQNITAAVVKLFEDSSGFLIRVSDLYRVTLAVPGVIGFTIRRILFEHIDFTNPSAGDVLDEYRTDQDPTGAAGGPFNPMQDVIIPGAADRAFYDDSFLFNNEILFDSEIDLTTIQAINLRSLTFELIAG